MLVIEIQDWMWFRQTTVFFALSLVILLFIARFLFTYSHGIPKNSPAAVSGNFPLTGSWGFWGRRWDFSRNARDRSATGNYSFHVGKNHIIGLSGDKGRNIFFDKKEMGLVEGYAALFGEAPNIQEHENIRLIDDHTSPFNRRVVWLLKSDQLMNKLPTLISDVRAGIEDIASKERTNPFVDIYHLVFTLTIRMVGAHELAEDPVLRARFEYYFDLIDQSATPLSAMFPWFPWPAIIQRTYAGFRLYTLLDGIVKKRRETGKAPDDAVQHLLGRGDGMTEIVYFITGALFAGQLNSGINAAMVLCYLATSPEWLSKVRAEVHRAAAKHGKDPKASIMDKLGNLSLDAWESEFPTVQLCLRDSIRLNMPGTFFRKHTGSKPIFTGHGDEVVPPGSFPVYHVADVHMDPDVYAEPDKWDPSRYMPERGEDRKRPHAYLGWGSGRHPCQGMRFAKLEQNIITAYFVATFDFQLEDEHGKTLTRMEHGDIEAIANHVPKKPYFLRTRRLEQLKLNGVFTQALYYPFV